MAKTSMMNEKRIHRESLLHIPLVSEMMEDTSIRFLDRALDSDWIYEKILTDSVTAFNPSLGAISYARKSQMAQWLKAPSASARRWNVRDYLVNEVLFAVHDYLHIWAYQAIDHLLPDLRFGRSTISDDQVEVMVFCHLLTEAVATCGLDYWFLSQVDLRKLLPIGSNVTSLAASYRENFDLEFKRFGVDLKVFDESFFETLTNFYLSGEIESFSTEMLVQSPVLLTWMTHELKYGQNQRTYTRQWMQHLAGQVSFKDDAYLSRPVAHRARWQTKLTRDVGSLLWRKVVGGEKIRFKQKSSSGWKAAKIDGPTDFRFYNLNHLGDQFWDKIKDHNIVPDSRSHFFAQLLSKYEFEKLDPTFVRLLVKLKTQFDVKELQYLFRDFKPLKVSSEPAELFFPN